MTPEEQAPVLCVNCGQAIRGVGMHMDGSHDWWVHDETHVRGCVPGLEGGTYAEPPAPEETVETTEERRPFKITWERGAYYVSIPNYGGGWVVPVEPPAPEPAGEAEEPPPWAECVAEMPETGGPCGYKPGDYVHKPGAYRYHTFQPAPSSETPGLTEAQDDWDETAWELFHAWEQGLEGDDLRLANYASFYAGYKVAAEVRAPLEARIAELEAAYDTAHGLWQVETDMRFAAERQLEEMRAWADDLCWQQLPGGRCNTARSHTIHDGYCYGCDSDVPHSHHLFWPKEATEEYWADRALTPPASTATEETTG